MAVDLLRSVHTKVGTAILGSLERIDPSIAHKFQSRQYTFPDLVTLFDDKSIQMVLREVDSTVLAKALIGASQTVQDRIFQNLSQRAAQTMKKRMASLGRLSASSVQDSQRKIMTICATLEIAGEIKKMEPVAR